MGLIWMRENNRCRLNFKNVRPEFNKITKDNLTLICPKVNLWDWEDEERWLRSVIVDEKGYVVSCGWPKFGNYGEFKDDANVLNKELESNGIIRFSNKEDGSLCIRSVINGKVIFRTRGTIDGGFSMEDKEPFGERFKRTANKYPILFDTNIEPNRSLLFEYVSPDNTIIVNYKNEDLIFLGFTDHFNLEIGTWEETKDLSIKYNLNLVSLHNLPNDLIEITEKINEWKTEGIVVRCYKDQVFVKIKSAKYLANHKLKFSMNYKMIVEFIFMYNLFDENKFIEFLKSCGWDWELIECAKVYYQKFKTMEEKKNRILNIAKDILNNFNNNCKELEEKTRRKNLALQLYGNNIEFKKFIVPITFGLYENRIDKVESICKKFIFNERGDNN